MGWTARSHRCILTPTLDHRECYACCTCLLYQRMLDRPSSSVHLVSGGESATLITGQLLIDARKLRSQHESSSRQQGFTLCRSKRVAI